MNNKILIITCSVIISVAVIISAGLIISQVLKQNSIERQTQMKIDQDNKVLDIEKAEKTKIEAEKTQNKLLLSYCLEGAEDSYWSYAELNGTGKREIGIKAPRFVWEIANKNKQNDIDNCYKRYSK